jgi:hypothetical protein
MQVFRGARHIGNCDASAQYHRQSRHEPVQDLRNRSSMILSAVVIQGNRGDVGMPGKAPGVADVAVEGVKRGRDCISGSR